MGVTYASLRFLVSKVEFVEIFLSALPWHSRGTVNKDSQLLPSGHQGIHIVLRELHPLLVLLAPTPPGFFSLLFSLQELKY